MKAVDTNVLLRHIVQDDPAQSAKASTFLTERTVEDPAFVSLIVVAELTSALKQRYRYSREQIQFLFTALLETAELVFEEEQFLTTLIDGKHGGDIADHLIAFSATRAGCTSTMTFDRRAAKSISSMEFLA